MSVQSLSGRDLDCAVVRELFHWKEIPGPIADCDGPCESFPVLIDPSWTPDSAYSSMPPRGVIKTCYFVPKFSTDKFHLDTILRHFERIGYLWVVKGAPDDMVFEDGDGRELGYQYACELHWRGFRMNPPRTDDMPSRVVGFGDTYLEAICRAGVQLGRLMRND
jgi:hypothetical protein